MSPTVCLTANTFSYPEGGGLHWVYLNWALGLRALGARVIWMEVADPGQSADEVQTLLAALRRRLEPFGLSEGVALCTDSGEPLPPEATAGSLAFEAAAGADLLLSLRYSLGPAVVGRFRRSALIDIDPGLLQVWLSQGSLAMARYDTCFSIGETVGRPGARFRDAGRAWHYTPPCVALDWWPVCPAPAGAPFTTVTHWHAREHVEDETGEYYRNDKRSGFEPFFGLPRHTDQPLELALCLSEDEEGDRQALLGQGWRLRHSHEVAPTPLDYRRYVQGSRGEFSCAKPSYVRMDTAWVSDRTLCYLASGKPAVVQHTGPSRFLPDAAGLFRFRDPDEAARCLGRVAEDYDRQCRLARGLAEEFFDARRVAKRLLEKCLS
jgi:glycosyltransferase involved in cell wall biosynthesis